MSFNPFKKTLSPTEFPNAPCRWCTKRIGLVDHRYIPLCDKCWRLACDDLTGKLWERLCMEFDSEMRAWVNKQRSKPNHLQTIEFAQLAQEEINALGQVIERARLVNDSALIADTEAQIRDLTAKVERLKVEYPATVKAIEASDA